MRLTFAYSWILYLIWCVPLWALLLHLLRQRRRNKLAAFTGNTLAAKLLPKAKPRLEMLQISATLLAITLLLMAAAGPRSTQRREQESMVRGRDIVVLVDVSRSMLANDLQPSRLVRAKADLLDILDEMRPGDRFALVAFRHRATRITPFTSDQRFLRQSVSALSIHSAPGGETDIGAAIRMALSLFDDDSPAHKAVIMLSDGEDLAEDAIRAAQDAGQKKIPFFTVGLGSRNGSTIPQPESPQGIYRHEGEPVITKLEAASLVTLARLTGGAYIPIETAGVGTVTLGQHIRDHLRSVEAQVYATIETGDYAQRFSYFLLPAILLLLLAGSVSQGQLRTARRRLGLVVFLLAYVANSSHAQEPHPLQPDNAEQSHRQIARQAQKLQREGAHHDAAQLYKEAANQADLPRSTQDRYRYNAAIAALQAGDHETAIGLLDALPPIHQIDLAKALAHFQRGKEAPDGSAEGYRNRAEQWEMAARQLQQFWQRTGTPEAEQDLQTLDSMLPLAKHEANVADILERYAEASPDNMAWEILQEQRQQHAATDTPHLPPIGPERLAYFAEQARRRKEVADQYLALSHHLQTTDLPPETLQSLQQQQQHLAQQAEALRDLDPIEAPAAEMGHPLYNTWRAIATPDTLLSESLRQQEWLQELSHGNTTQQPPVPPAALQTEAGALTERFAERFQPPPDTDPETIEQIHELAAQAGKLQRLAAEMLAIRDENGAREVQQEALDTLRQLSELLPQPPPEESPQQQDQQPDQDPSDEPDGEPDQDNEAEADTPPPPPDDPPTNEKPEDTEDQQEEDAQESEDDTFDLDAMMEQVEQRAQEYRERAEERRQRIRQPGSRDW